MRIRLIVAYDGTEYCGWQIQPNGITVEEVLNNALTELLGEEITVLGASRTDSGVHSLGNVAIFDTNTRMEPSKIALALNQRLPEDVVVQKSEQVADDWHPHKAESRKTYEYRILNTRVPIPTLRRDTYFYHHSLDLGKMQEAAKRLEGQHDFAGFCSAGAQVKTTVRTIYECAVTESKVGDGRMITIRVTGNGFLYNMVRIIAGTLLAIGNDRMPVDAIDRIFETKDRTLAGPTAPAQGLTMMGIEYLDEL